MSIFNSLGSNYNFRFVINSFLGLGNHDSKQRLMDFLQQKYQGRVVLTYKGRQALELALQAANLPAGSKVAITGFTCWAVYQAVAKSNLRPVLLDIESDDLNFTVGKLKKVLGEQPGVRAVIVQNTLGYPLEIEEMNEICQQKGLLLIEDLAHCVGAVYKNGVEAGLVGDLVALSFSQDKIIDGVSGGALIIRTDRFKGEIVVNQQISLRQLLNDWLYPLWTFLIRNSYQTGLGKVFHFVLKKMKLMSSSVDGKYSSICALPSYHAKQVLFAFANLTKNLAHRRRLAQIYADNLPREVLFNRLVKLVQHSSNLRFPIMVFNRSKLTRYLQQNNIYLADIWYDSPIAPSRFWNQIDYHGECPVAEQVSKEILNLPTHINISTKQAYDICWRINSWLKQQS